ELIPYEFNADVNTWVTTNAARSVHQGIEATGSTWFRLPGEARLTLRATPTLSDNHFARFDDVLDATTIVSRGGKAIPYFPAIQLNGSGSLAWKRLSLGAEARYAGRIYVDNSQSVAYSVSPHTVLDLKGTLM